MVNFSSPREAVKNAIRIDPSFRAIMFPHQCFIGNLSILLCKNMPFEVFVMKNKLYAKFPFTERNGGVIYKEFIFGFSQFRSISLKSEGSESESARPAIIFRLTTAASHHFLRGLEDNAAYKLTERGKDANTQEYLKSTIILILQDDPKYESEQVFMQCIVKSFGAQENPRVINFDQKTGYDIWKTDINLKWKVTMSEKWRNNFVRHVEQLVDDISAGEFNQLMNALGLKQKIMDNDRKYMWFGDPKVTALNSFFKKIQNDQKLSEEKGATKRKAEDPPVKHGPLCTIHLINHNHMSNDPPLYSINCRDDRHVYIQYLVNEEDMEQVCNCRKNYEKRTKYIRKPPFDQSDGLPKSKNEVLHQDCGMMNFIEEDERNLPKNNENPPPQAANLRIFEQIEEENEPIFDKTEAQSLKKPVETPILDETEAQSFKDPVETPILDENRMLDDEKCENSDGRVENSRILAEITPRNSEDSLDNAEKPENQQNLDENAKNVTKCAPENTIDVENLDFSIDFVVNQSMEDEKMTENPQEAAENAPSEVVEVEISTERMAEGDRPEYYNGRTEDIPLPATEYQPGPSGNYAQIVAPFPNFGEDPFAHLKFENSNEAMASFVEQPLTIPSEQLYFEAAQTLLEPRTTETPMPMFDYTQGDGQTLLDGYMNTPLPPVSNEQWLAASRASAASLGIPSMSMRNTYCGTNEPVVAPSPQQSSIGNALFTPTDNDDYGLYAEYFTMPPPPPPPPATVFEPILEPIQPVSMETQHPIPYVVVQPVDPIFATPFPMEQPQQSTPEVSLESAVTALKSLKVVSGQKIVTKRIVRRVPNEAVHLSDDEGEKSVVVAVSKPKNEEIEKKVLEVTDETPILTSSHSNFGSVVIIVKDMHTLARQEFVNDNIINFTIDYMYDCRIIKSIRDKIHVFVTFFYSRLSGGLNSALMSTNSGLTQDEKNKLDKNINLVSRWTLKKFDLFTKEYIVIPINEEFHWLVAIVVNPSGAIVEKDNEEETRKKPKCYIVFLDPLTGLDPRRQKNMTTLIKYYLNGLFTKSKMPGTKFATPTESFWDETRIEVFRPKNQPVQANYYDCGLFVLYYIEAFFCGIKPITVHDMPGFDWMDHFEKGEDIADMMRDKVYNTITRLLTSENRSRLEQHERRKKHGLSTEGARRHRRHSAPWPRALPREPDYHVRHYSLSPQRNNIQDNRIFNNPRELSKMSITQRVRALRLPEEKFASMY